MRILLLAFLTLAGNGTPGVQTISGSVTANTGDSITVASADRSLTCQIRGTRAQAVILRWGTGVRVGMACKTNGDSAVLWRLIRLGTKEPGSTLPPGTDQPGPNQPTDQPKGDPPTTTTPSGDGPKTTPPPTQGSPPAASQPRKDARGVVVSLSGDGVTVQPDAGGDPFACSITPAPDSQAAAAKLTLGARVGIVCRLDGGRYVLAGATPVT